MHHTKIMASSFTWTQSQTCCAHDIFLRIENCEGRSSYI